MAIDRAKAEETGKLYGELRQPLMRFFTPRVSNAAEAEDLTHETFSRLLGMSVDTRIANAKGFVFQVAMNLLRDRARRAKVRNEAMLSDVTQANIDEVAAEFLEDRDPERVLLGKEGVEQVVKVLGELKERTRDIYLLFRLENMKQRDIAELYGISQSTVEKEIMRATLHLAVRFGKGPR